MCPDDLKQAIADAIRPMREDVKLVKHLLTGNGEPEKGVVLRLDRLEQTEKSRGKVIWTAITTAVGSAVAWAVTAFKSQNP